MLRSPEKGHGRGLPFRPGSAAYRAGVRADADAERDAGSGDSDRGYHLVEVYEAFGAEYGWSPGFIEGHLTDEQLALYVTRLGQRRAEAALADLDRIVTGTSWGVAIAFDAKGRNARKWRSIRQKGIRHVRRERGLSGRALEQAVMALAVTDPSLVKVEAAGAK